MSEGCIVQQKLHGARFPPLYWKKVGIISNFDDFCKNKDCPEHMEWELKTSDDEQPYPCVSCMKMGQSYNIIKYPKDCLFLEEIKLHEFIEALEFDHAEITTTTLK